MENKILKTDSLALCYDGRSVIFGTIARENLFVSLDCMTGVYFEKEQYNKGLLKNQNSIIVLNDLYSKDSEYNKKYLRSQFDTLEDATLLCLWKRRRAELKDLKKVELFLTKSINSRIQKEEAVEMFEEIIAPMLEEGLQWE